MHNPVLEPIQRMPLIEEVAGRLRRTRTLPRRERRETAHDAIAAGDAEQAAERMESHLLEFARESGVKASAPITPEKAR
jgi:DNA-binding GntR family transcriptional regulator